MKTRSRGSAKPITVEAQGTEASTPAPISEDNNVPKTFILPKNASTQARIVSLPNPATSSTNRYFVCPDRGFFEFTKVGVPKTTPRSFLFTPKCFEKPNCSETQMENESENEFSDGYVMKVPDIFIATPIDPLFFILPALVPPSAKASQKQMFLSLDDHLDTIVESSRHLRILMRISQVRNLVERRMEACCDSVDAGDEKMYRISKEKLLRELITKAKRMCESGLPASMEERFVQRELALPFCGVKREELSESIIESTPSKDVTSSISTPSPSATQATTSSDGSLESQQSSSTTATTMTSVSDKAVSVEAKPQSSITEGVTNLLRIRTAFNFMATSYIMPHLRKELQDMLSAQSELDFGPLNEHLAHVASLRAEALALRQVTDNITRKRTLDDDEAADVTAEKKRKRDEEDLKRKTESRAVKQLKKVDTSGMKKLSSFFSKAPGKK
jgi:hypothetical protein